MMKFEKEKDVSVQKGYPVVEMAKDEIDNLNVKGRMPRGNFDKIAFKIVDPQNIGEGQYRESMDPWYEPLANQKPRFVASSN